jgi:WD40 repeat protein
VEASRKRHADDRDDDVDAGLANRFGLLEADGQVHQWTSPLASRLMLAGHTPRVSACAFSADSQVMATGSSDCTLSLWRVDTGTCFTTLYGHAAGVKACAFSPDGTTLVSAGGRDKMLKLWSMSTLACHATLAGHTASACCCAVSPNSRLVMSGSSDCTVRVWHSTTGECLMTLKVGHASNVLTCKFGMDGTTIAAAATNVGFKSWILPTTTGTEHGSTTWDDNDNLLDVASSFSPSGASYLAACTDYALRLWDVSTGACRMTLHGHTSVVLACAFSPGGTLIASGDAHGTLKLWEADMGSCLRTVSQLCAGPLSVCAFSPDGCTLLAGGASLQLLPDPLALPRRQRPRRTPPQTAPTTGQTQ